MKVAVCDRGIPADHHVAADPQLQFAEQDGIREVAEIADRRPCSFAQGEVRSIHHAMGADDEGLIDFAPETLERVLACEQRVGADPGIRG